MAREAQKVGKIEVENFNFIWKIKDFEKLGKQVGDKVCSPMFQIKHPVFLSPYHWYFELYPYGNGNNFKGCLSISLHNDFSQNYPDIEVNLKITLLSHINSKEYGNSACGIATFKSNSKNIGRGTNNMISRKELFNQRDSLLVDNTLIIKCIIQFNPYSREELYLDSFHNNFRNLYSDERFSDVTIQIGRKRIKAHKCILAARSRTFSDIFQKVKHEIGPTLIKITDFDYEVMNEVLSFIYCDKVSNIQQHVKPLLQAAFNYKLDRLKVMCGRVLWKQLSIDNAVETSKIADSYGCSELKSKAMQFIIKNMKDVGQSGGFKVLTVEKPELLEEILCAVAEKN